MDPYLGQEQAKTQDNTRKHHLEPDRYPPRVRSRYDLGTIWNKRTWDAPDEPESVVDSSHDTTEGWVGHF